MLYGSGLRRGFANSEKVTPYATFNVGVFNLGDKRYIDWSNVGSTLSPGSRVLDRYTNPGRTLSASLAVSW